MAADQDDAAITEELPVLPASWIGQAPPVVIAEDELDERDELEDPSASRARFTAPDLEEAPAPPVAWSVRVANSALVTVLVLVAMVPVAFGFAVATP